MDHPVNVDVLEERWLQRFNEFQGLRSQRTARQTTAREELDAAQREIAEEMSNIQNEENQRIEVIKGEAEAKIRQIEEKTNAEIQRLQYGACRKTAEIHEVTKKDLGLLQVVSQRKTQELEDKRMSRKRKHEDDNQEIEREFVTRLKALETSCMPSVCTASRISCEGTIADQNRPYQKRRHLP